MAGLPKRVSPLLAALAVSVAAHLVALFGNRIDLTPAPDFAKLEATLTRAAPDKRPGEAPKPKQPPQPKVTEPAPAEQPPTPVAEAQDPPVEAPPQQPAPPAEAKAEPQPEVPPAPPEPPKAVGSTWPRAGAIRYLLFGGENRTPGADSTAELKWEIGPDGRYAMKLESRDAKPFPSMPWFTISLLWSSQGRLVDGRFRPERYEEAISVFQRIVVNLDWDKKTVDFAGHQLALPEGTLDYLSVIMQAGDPGFIGAGTLAVATGRGLRQYRFESLGQTDLALPFGMTWKTTQLVGKTGNNDVRVWVANEKFNLPVQIKFVVNKVNYYLVATEVLVAKDAVEAQRDAAAAAAAAADKPQEMPHALDPAAR